MVQVVAGDDFDDIADFHFAEFGMVDGFFKDCGGEGPKEGDEPSADAEEDGEGGGGVDRGIRVGPEVLIEGLDGVVGLGGGLAEAEGEGDFAVG